MDTCEIYINRKSLGSDLYCAVKTGLKCSEKINSAKSLSDYLLAITSPFKIMLYVSDDDSVNTDADDLISAISEASVTNKNIDVKLVKDEFVNIIDDKDRLTSFAEPRSVAHKTGHRHPTVHIWIVRKIDMEIYILLQKRSHNKAQHPDCFDVSSAGHVSAGDEYRISAIRELSEELGLYAEPKQLEFIGMRKSDYSDNDVHDNELSAVYIYRQPIETEKLRLQTEEVSQVSWIDIDECLTLIKNPKFKHCLYKDELLMIKKAVR